MKKKRASKAPPLSRIHINTASAADILASLDFTNEYREAKAAIDQLRQDHLEARKASGDPLYESEGEMLARLFAYNVATQAVTLKAKGKGVATRQADAAARAEDIRKRLAEPGASLRAVAGELEMLGLPARSLRTVVRAKKGQK